MRRPGGIWRRLTPLAAASALAACGGGDICLNCPSGSPTPSTAVLVTGKINRLSTFNPFSDVTVIVCLDLEPDKQVTECPKVFLAQVDDGGAFVRSGVEPGPETIFFWIDENDDGTVDPGDPIAHLLDPDGLLDEVPAGRTVKIEDAVVDFTTETATATISVTTTPTPTPQPSATPTATPAPTRTP